jgi:hypothetical protein
MTRLGAFIHSPYTFIVIIVFLNGPSFAMALPVVRIISSDAQSRCPQPACGAGQFAAGVCVVIGFAGIDRVGCPNFYG